MAHSHTNLIFVLLDVGVTVGVSFAFVAFIVRN